MNLFYKVRHIIGAGTENRKLPVFSDPMTDQSLYDLLFGPFGMDQLRYSSMIKLFHVSVCWWIDKLTLSPVEAFSWRNIEVCPFRYLLRWFRGVWRLSSPAKSLNLLRTSQLDLLYLGWNYFHSILSKLKSAVEAIPDHATRVCFHEAHWYRCLY